MGIDETQIIGTINVGGYGFWRRERVAREAFRFFPAKLIGFQELTESARITFERTGYEFFMGEPTTAEDHQFHTAIAYDTCAYTRIDTGTIWLTKNGKRGIGWDGIAERTATWVLLRTRAGTELLFINTQFDNVGTEARHESMKRLLQHAQDFSRVPHQIIQGDLNMSVGRSHPKWPAEKKRPYHLALENGFIDAYTAAKPERVRARTFHHFQGDGCGEDEWGTYDPDYVFTKGLNIVNCVFQYPTVPGSCTYASDHAWGVTDAQFTI